MTHQMVSTISNRNEVYRPVRQFDFVPPFAPRLEVRRRFVWFYAKPEGVGRAIGKAKRFSQPNNICIIFVVGYLSEEIIRQKLPKKGNFMIVTMPPESTELIDKIEHSYSIKWYLGQHGYRSTKPLSYLRDIIWKMKREIANGDRSETDEEYLQSVELYNQCEEWAGWRNAFADMWKNNLTSYGIYNGELFGDTRRLNRQLMYVISDVFPYGIEEYTARQEAYKPYSITDIDNAINGQDVSIYQGGDCGFHNRVAMYDMDGNLIHVYPFEAYAAAMLGISRFAVWRGRHEVTSHARVGNERLSFRDYTMEKPAQEMLISSIEQIAKESLAKDGKLRVQDCIENLKKPPYGYCDNAYYVFCLTKGLMFLVNEPGYYYNDGEYYGDMDADVLRDIIIEAYSDQELTKKHYIIYKHTPEHEEAAELLRKFFHIDTEGRPISFNDVLNYATRMITLTIRANCLDNVSHELYNILMNIDDPKRNYLDELVALEQHSDDVLNAISDADANLRKELREKYSREMADKYFRCTSRRGESRELNTTREQLYQIIDEYMSSELCTKCYASLKTVCVIGDNSHDFCFTYEQTKVLNQKIRGTTSGGLCVKCLRKILGCMPKVLWNMLDDEQEDGDDEC